MKIKPLHNNIVIKQDDAQEVKYKNIIVADLGKEKPLQGIVVATGPGIYTMGGIYIPTNVKVGQRVVFPTFGGVRISVEGEEYIVSKETDILVILAEDDEVEVSDPNDLPF